MARLAIYTETKLLPPVADILKELFAEFPEVTDTFQWDEYIDRSIPVLVLGVMPEIVPPNYVKTLSQKQILSNPAALTELKVAVKNLLTPPVFPPMQWKLFEGQDDASKALDSLGDVVVVDIETGGDVKTWLPEEQWLLSVALNDGKNPIVVLGQKWLSIRENIERLLAFLLRKNRKLIAHNMKFDFRTLTAQLGKDIKGHHDTMLMHHAINPGAKQHGLKELCAKYLGAPDWDKDTSKYAKGHYKDLTEEGLSALLEDGYAYPKEMIRKYGTKPPVGYEAIPKSILYEYNAYDVYWTWHLFEYLLKFAKGDPRLAKLAKFEFEMSNFFQDVEVPGVGVDLEYLEELRVKYDEWWEKVMNSIWQHTAHPTLNINSPVQVKKMYEEYGVPLKSTAEKVLEELDFTDNPEAQKFTELLLEARGVSKMKGTYVEGIRKRTHDGLVHPSFLVHGTSTGRLSSAGPNIQNIPRDEEGEVSLRRIFIPRAADRSLVNVDYGQAELRVMAELSNDEYLISLFQPDMPDFFDSLMPVAYPGVELDKLDKNTKKNMRAKLKGVIYGMSYGRRAAAIAKELKMSEFEAQKIINNYFKAAPSLYEWRQWVSAMAVNPEETLISPFGRYYQAEVVTGRNAINVTNSGLAFLPQSTASDICVTAAMAIHKWMPEYDSYIVATVHDAILSDVPDKYAQEVGERVQYEMEQAATTVFHRVPFQTDLTIGKSWMGL